MKTPAPVPNQRYEHYHEVLLAHPEWFHPWVGTVFRFQTVDFPTAEDILSGEGARKRGGRWNRPGIAAVYGSTTDTTALEECKANDLYYGILTKSPRLVIAIEVHLARVVDLTIPKVRRALGFSLKESAAEDWRKIQYAGHESDGQMLGRAIRESGASGLLARSAAVHLGTNVVIFPEAHPRDRLSVVNADKLSRLKKARD